MSSDPQSAEPANEDMSYVSGFFDGEGAIRVMAVRGSSLLTISVVICQKSEEVLRGIQGTLHQLGIH
ncbi:MAG: LAGLIDADG family homing endonuclease [Thaumarchaeota archaeon]|nr:LAGLIDADG family homing endonuclease [Nitrososphaerota archaeon]